MFGLTFPFVRPSADGMLLIACVLLRVDSLGLAKTWMQIVCLCLILSHLVFRDLRLLFSEMHTLGRLLMMLLYMV